MLKRKILTVGMVGLLAMGVVGCSEKKDTTTDTQQEQEQQQEQQTQQEDNKNVTLNISEVMDKITTEYQEKMPIGTPLDAESIPYLYGETMTEEVYEDFGGIIPMMVSTSEVTIFKAKEGKVEEVIKALEFRQTNQLQAFEQYLPDQYEIVKNSKILVNGNYVMFISADEENFEGIQSIIESGFKQN